MVLAQGGARDTDGALSAQSRRLTDVHKRTVLFIAGWGRTGSTVLGNILGQLPAFCFVGELANVWTCGVVDNAPCGCGVRFRDCEMWRAVFQRAFGGIDGAHARRMMELRKRWPNNKALLLRSALGQGILPDVPDPDAAEYAEGLRRLYDAIGEYAEGRIIVDSSKLPSYALAVGSLPNVDLRLVHLVRDPRATAYSWLRRIDAVENMATKRLAVWQSSAQWTSWNATTDIVAKALALPAMRLSYEDFVQQPREAVLSALKLVRDIVAVETDDLPFVSPHEVELHSTHNVWGNLRYRQRVGRVGIVPDDEWNTGLTPLARLVIAGLTYPLARKYGYYGK